MKRRKGETGDIAVQGKAVLMDFVKGNMFDLIATGVIISMILLTLNIFQLREITWRSAINLILEWMPFYLCAVLLNTNFYNKGVFFGKKKDTFTNILKTYSTLINALTGKQLEKLPEFCEMYNERALKDLRTPALKKLGISYELFNDGHIDSQDASKNIPALKTLTNRQLLKYYDKHIVKQLRPIIRMSVKGVNPNKLLGNYNNIDQTDLGPDESDLKKKRLAGYGVGFIFSIGFLTLISVKSIMEWGWAGVVFAAFKILYIVARSYLRYFQGYDDIVTKVSNHISRKTDILKEFKSWESDRYEVTDTDTAVQGNDADN